MLQPVPASLQYMLSGRTTSSLTPKSPADTLVAAFHAILTHVTQHRRAGVIAFQQGLHV